MSMNALVADGSPNSAETPNVASTQYSPLPHDGDSFRLLRVLPSPISISRIRCELYTASISREEDKYIAGSYVWGPPEPSKPIVINGKSFQVRSNLFRFLRAFRSRHRSQVIWIDAICINQDDIHERGHQVQEMKRIYSNAKCVYCWLNLKNAMPYTSIFSSHRVKDLLYWRRRDERRCLRHEKQAGYLIQAEYWSRIWIVQEFLLAKDLTLLMGSRRLSARRFEIIMRHWTENPPDGINLSNASFLVSFRRGHLSREFEQMFTLFADMLCSLPQDAVFALLGLVGERTKDTELIGMIDYSLTVWQLLQCILARDIIEYPLQFAYHYWVEILRNQEDKDTHMHDVLNVQLRHQAHLSLRDLDDSRYTNLDGLSLRMALALPVDGSSSKPGVTGIILAVHTRDRPTVLEQAVVSLQVYSSTGPDTAVSILFEACDSQCSTACMSHRIIGFEWKPSWVREHGLELEPPKKLINLPLLMRNSESSLPIIISELSLEFRAILQTTNTKCCVVRDRFSQYTLETDLETMEKLVDFVYSIRRSRDITDDAETREHLSEFTKGVGNDWSNVQSEAYSSSGPATTIA
jgi:hypothetical protein